MKKLIPLLFLLNSCVGADYVEVSPFAGYGNLNFDRPVSNADGEEYGLMFTMGWDIGERAHMQRKSLYGTPAPAPPTVIIPDQKGDPPVVVENDTFIENIIPDTEKEGKIIFYGSLGLLALMLSAVLGKSLGIHLPFVPSKKKQE